MAFLFGRTKSNASLAIIQSTKSHLEETLNAQLVSQQLSVRLGLLLEAVESNLS